MIKDLTRGNPTRLILLFTLPLLIGNVFQQLYSLMDALIVGRTLGVNALGAVGCTGSIIFLITGFSWGLTSGLAIPTARHFGAGNMAAMRKSVAAGAWMSLAISAVLTAAGLIFARPLLVMLRTPDVLMPEATTFAIISFAGLATSVFYNYLAATIRALGDSRTPLIFLVVGCLINIALVFAFISWLHTGVGGAAMATVLAQFLAAAACLVYAWRRIPDLRLSRADWRIGRAELVEVGRIGLPMGFQTSVIGLGTILLQWVLNGLGATEVAAYTAAARIEGIAVAPMMSFGVAIATFTAQNLGAREFARIRAGVARCAAITIGFSLVVGVILLTLGHHLAAAFVTDGHPEVISTAHTFLQINGALYGILAALFVFRNAIQGLGHSLVPTIAGFMELLLRGVGAMLLAGPMGFAGVCLANPLAWLGALIPVLLAWLVSRRGLIRDQAELEARTPGRDAPPADALQPDPAMLPGTTPTVPDAVAAVTLADPGRAVSGEDRTHLGEVRVLGREGGAGATGEHGQPAGDRAALNESLAQSAERRTVPTEDPARPGDNRELERGDGALGKVCEPMPLT